MNAISRQRPVPPPVGRGAGLGGPSALLGLAGFVLTLLILLWKVGLRPRRVEPDPIAERAARMRRDGVPEGRIRRYVERERTKAARRESP